MKRILIILVLFSATIAYAQTRTFEKEVQKISKRIELITKSQKDSLKIRVIEIDKQLENGAITKTIADALKKEAASYHAKQIEKKVTEQERLLQLLIQDKTNGKIVSSNDSILNEEDINTFKVGNTVFKFSVSNKDTPRTDKKNKKSSKRNRQSTSQFVFAMGFNNVLVNNQFASINNSEYQFSRSRFYEVGYTTKTRFTQQASQLYFKYGISFLWNNLRPDHNQYHVKNKEVTELQVFTENLSESRLRHVQMNFPVHIEWDLSKNTKYKDGFVYDKTNTSLRVGVGGFVGFKLGTRQYLEYNNVENVAYKGIQYDNFNMNILNYGVSAYVGYKSTSLYVKYDLNPLFKNTETRNISMGLRFDLN